MCHPNKHHHHHYRHHYGRCDRCRTAPYSNHRHYHHHHHRIHPSAWLPSGFPIIRKAERSSKVFQGTAVSRRREYKGNNGGRRSSGNSSSDGNNNNNKTQQQQTSQQDLSSVKDENTEDKVPERISVPAKRTEDDKFRTSTSQHFDRRLVKVSTFSDITEIGSHLLLCGAVALRGNILQDLNVTCVINATRELPDTPLPNAPEGNILYLRVNVDDRPESNIFPWLDMVADVIHQVKMAGGKSLIHCVAGISRSATLCLAYLMKYEGRSLRDSYFLLKSLRHTIRPNCGFFGQLVEFEREVTGRETVSMVRSHLTNTWIPQVYEEEIGRYEDLSRQRRRCRP